MKCYLAPSILAADFTRLGEQVKAVEEAGAEFLHLDVMDGAFVPSISFGMPVIQSLRKQCGMLFDVHLMIEDPDRYLEDFVKCGADMIVVHAEACRHLHRTVTRIKELGVKVGVALNPATPVETIQYVLPELDMVLIMSVNPGFGGQKYIPFSADKIRQVRQMAEKVNPELMIQVDGGINKDTVKLVMEAGANVFVAGTAVFGGDIAANVQTFKAIFAGEEA